MAMFRQIFTRIGTVPDLPSLIATIRPTIGDPFYIGVQSDNGLLTLAVDKPTAWLAGDVTTVQTAVTAAVTATEQTAAQANIDTLPILLKSLLLCLLDQINVLRGDISTLGIARPPITPAQGLAAARAKAGSL